MNNIYDIIRLANNRNIPRIIGIKFREKNKRNKYTQYID